MHGPMNVKENYFCVSIPTMVTRKRHDVTLYVYYLRCFTSVMAALRFVDREVPLGSGEVERRHASAVFRSRALEIRLLNEPGTR
jgi:hypothetical protein